MNTLRTRVRVCPKRSNAARLPTNCHIISGRPRSSAGRSGSRFHVADDVVGEVTHRSRVQGWKPLDRLGGVALQQLLHHRERVSVGKIETGVIDLGHPVVAGHREHRVPTQERPLCPSLASLQGLEQESG